MQWFASFFPRYKILLALDSLIIICLDMNLFKLILLGVCLSSWMYWFMYFFKFEMLSALFLQVSFSPPSLFPLLLRLSLLIFSTILDNVTGISGVVYLLFIYLLLLLFIVYLLYFYLRSSYWIFSIGLSLNLLILLPTQMYCCESLVNFSCKLLDYLASEFWLSFKNNSNLIFLIFYIKAIIMNSFNS